MSLYTHPPDPSLHVLSKQGGSKRPPPPQLGTGVRSSNGKCQNGRCGEMHQLQVPVCRPTHLNRVGIVGKLAAKRP